MALAADCCSAKWSLKPNHARRPGIAGNDSRIGVAGKSSGGGSNNGDKNGNGPRGETHGEDENDEDEGDDDEDEDDDGKDDARVPPPLEESLVHRMLNTLKTLLEPIPEDYALPAQTLLGQVSRRNVPIPRAHPSPSGSDLLDEHLAELDTYVKVVVEYITASSWQSAFDYFRNAIYGIRATGTSTGPEPPKSTQDTDETALVIVRLLSFFWVDGPKLRLVIQEICSSYLHFRRPYQNAVAIVIPLLIIRWTDRYPREFVQLHLLRQRVNVPAETLFDMVQRISDNAKMKHLLYPLQTALLFLLPDVFEVASNLKEAKSSSMVKKVSFLDNLRKSLRNRQETAAYCLVSLLRAARHFDAESDSALVSYAMDVQDEVRDAIFRTPPSITSNTSSDPSISSQDLVTAAFVSLAHLNLNSSVGALVDTCIASSAPDSFKIACVQGCCYFAEQPYARLYQGLFSQVLPFMRSQLEVSHRIPKIPVTTSKLHTNSTI